MCFVTGIIVSTKSTGKVFGIKTKWEKFDVLKFHFPGIFYSWKLCFVLQDKPNKCIFKFRFPYSAYPFDMQ